MSNADFQYTVRRCRSDDTLFGPIHCGCDINGAPCYETLCKQRINGNWWILGNEGKEPITCKKCLDAMAPNAEIRDGFAVPLE